MEMQAVDSTNIKLVGWEAGTLRVEFHKGGVYEYAGVPEGTAKLLISSDSPGSFFARNIKGLYPTTKIR